MQRLVMECFSEALSAHCQGGIRPDRDTGVYVGVSQLEYARISYETGSALNNTYFATGAHLSVASGEQGQRSCMQPSMLHTLLHDLCNAIMDAHLQSISCIRLTAPV